MMGQLKAKSPQAFQIIEQARSNNSNPMDLFKQVTNGYSSEQMNSLFARAKQIGVPDAILQQIQNNDISTK
jgi:hypothetical protein